MRKRRSLFNARLRKFTGESSTVKRQILTKRLPQLNVYSVQLSGLKRLYPPAECVVTEAAARELLQRIEDARTALINWKPEPAPATTDATTDAGAAARVDGAG
jgi:hypothetical protein